MVSKSFFRFFKYSLVGFSTFVFDLGLLYFLTDVAAINYVIAAGISFAIAISVNHSISRGYVFGGSERTWTAGYINFLLIACIGLLIVTGGMYVLVGLLGLNYLISRICIAGVTGIWNYLLNLFVNFKVAGKH